MFNVFAFPEFARLLRDMRIGSQYPDIMFNMYLERTIAILDTPNVNLTAQNLTKVTKRKPRDVGDQMWSSDKSEPRDGSRQKRSLQSAHHRSKRDVTKVQCRGAWLIITTFTQWHIYTQQLDLKIATTKRQNFFNAISMSKLGWNLLCK